MTWKTSVGACAGCLCVLLSVSCAGIEHFVDVKDPSQAHAEQYARREGLSGGTEGFITASEHTDRKEPVGSAFLLPFLCADSQSLRAGGKEVALHGLTEVQSALAERRKLDPARRFELTCANDFSMGTAIAVNSPGVTVPLKGTDKYTLSTTPANVTRLREVDHRVRGLAMLTAVFAAIPASICGLGVAVTNPPPKGEPDPNDLAGQKATFTTCALVSAPIAAVGILVALLDPTIVTEYPIDGAAARR